MTGITDFINDRFRDLVVLLLAGLAYVEYAGVDLSGRLQLPAWVELAATALLLAILGGYFVAGRIDDLLPDPPRVWLVVQKGGREGGEIWKLTPDQFEAASVEGGPLMPWDDAAVRAYECTGYDADINTITANWREAPSASELLSHEDVSDAMDQMDEIQGEYERRARIGDAIRRRIGSIIRRLDRRRAEDQNRALQEHTAPSLEGNSVDEVIRDELGELVPERMVGDDEQGDDDRRVEEPEDFAFDLLDDVAEGEAMQPVADGGSEP
jgi:hypothetical protein